MAGSARQALIDATARFTFSATARLDAELLLAHALGIERQAFLLDLDRAVPPGFAALVERRAAEEPVAYLTGTRGFWTIELAVDPRVLIPRADSETLLEAAVAHFAGTAGPAAVLDLGTGSGALLLAALDQWPAATGVGVDASAGAVAVAQANARRLGLDARATIEVGGWGAAALPVRAGGFDLLLCNPPYVADDAVLSREVAGYEPASALYAGSDGLDDLRVLADGLRGLVAPGGVACLEIGHDQGAAAGALFRARGFGVALRQDLGGRDRCLVVTP
ncbi:peptide chain release factor N(5)-glutamine methyltransferase [Sphingomonas sp.]|uniref:peptide chain release factor N(5)-glutamine methyltransferase n=1 Tax=Sphingomonas sp. TaxID=28214 RepID=UPI003AFFBFA7